MIGDAPDAVVEANARRFLDGVIRDDRAQAASAVSYPLRINLANGKTLKIANATALLARWTGVFTPAYVARLKSAVPHDMFVNYQGAMVAQGAAWFDDRGASVLNAGAAGP